MEPHLVQLIKAVSTGKDACNVLILILKGIVLDLPQAILLICILRQVNKGTQILEYLMLHDSCNMD